MKMIKKIVALMAAVLMLCSIVPMSALSVAADTATYELYSGDLTEGDYIIYYSGKAMSAYINSKRFSYVSVTPANDAITNPDPSIVWHIAPNGSEWTLYNASTGTYAGGTGTKNQGALLSSVTDYALWSVTGTSTYEFVNKGNKAKGINSNLRNNNTYGFACYATGTGGALTLYKLADATGATECAHDNATGTAQKDATCTQDGNIAYWYCADCDQYFSDADCTDQISESDTVIAAGHNYGDDTTCDVCGEELQGYLLLQDADDLKVGDKIILVSSTGNYAMSTDQKTNNRGAVTITKNGSVITPVDNLQVITLAAGLNDGEFAFYTDAGYLYAAGSSGNHLKSQAAIDANASWTIVVTDGVASIVAAGSSNRNVMQFNYNNGSPLFACYASATQTALSIYYQPGNAPVCDYNHLTLQCGAKCPNECGYVNENAHAYTGDYDASCNNCDYVRTDSNLPAADSELTIPEAIAIGLGQDASKYTEDKYYITGKIVEFYGESWATYGNCYIEDENGNRILVYGLYTADGSTRFDAMATQPAIGDTITVYGIIGVYSGNAQMKNGYMTAHKPQAITAMGKSVTEEGNALAFRFKVNVSGMGIQPGYVTLADYSNATIIVEGEEYQLVAMGAVVTNGVSSVDIHAKYLYDLEVSSASFAVRIINIEEQYFDRTLTATPYFVIMKDGNEVRIEGAAVTGSVAEFID